MEWFWAFAINAILVLVFQKIPILTRNGWIHAASLGTILFGCLGFQGWISVVIYLILGSFVTRLGFKNKELKGLAESRGGKRGPENVWGSSLTSAIIAILIKSGFWSKELLLVGFVASYAAKLADTFGSEIGKRWGKKAVLITTLRISKPGTDGAISLEGTIASLFGSFLMTFSLVFIGLVPGGGWALLIVFIGFLATLIESLLGAIIQTKYNFLTNEVINAIQTFIAALIAIITFLLLGFK